MKTKFFFTFLLSIIIVISFGKNKLKKPQTGSWGTCITSATCQCPPVGCFRGGDQCNISPCKCPCSSLKSTNSVSELNELELVELAKQFAEDRMKDGTIETEDQRQILIDFMLKTLKSAK
jgi:hypothetical protein